MTALKDIANERQRQINMEGWTAAHDDAHNNGEMALAAICYAFAGIDSDQSQSRYWPWSAKWWKPTTNRRNLVKAGALIVAEIQRLDRMAGIDEHTCNSQYRVRELPDPACAACTPAVPSRECK